MIRRLPLYVVAAAYAVALVAVVLGPVSQPLNRLTVRLYVIWTYDLKLPGHPLPETFGTVLNVLLFIPLGMLIVAVARTHWVVAAGLTVMFSAAFELVQLLPSLDRTASWGDVVSNGIGGLIGAALASRLSRYRRRQPRGR